MRRALAGLVLAGLLLSRIIPAVWAGGGTEAGSSFFNCGTTESSLNSDMHTLMCDDFERTRNTSNVEIIGSAPLNPGTAIVTNCDSPAGGGFVTGENYPPNKGWCGTDSGDTSQYPYGVTRCAGAGANATNCAAEQLNGGSNVMTHAFSGHSGPTSCATGWTGARDANNGCRDSQAFPGVVKEYTELFMRVMYKPLPDFALFCVNGNGCNQKLNTYNRFGNGTGSIDFGDHGAPNGQTDTAFCPVMDCNYAFDGSAYFNPQNTRCHSQYLCQNTGTTAFPFAAGNNHWWAFEFHVLLNTGDSPANARNGVYQVWLDDCGTAGTSCPATQTLRWNYNNIAFRGDSANFNASGFPRVITTTNQLGLFDMDINTCCGAFQSTGTVLVDQIVVSTQPIGWMGATSSGPPAAPTNLHFGAWELRLMRWLGIDA